MITIKRLLISAGILLLLAIIISSIVIYLITRSPDMEAEIRPVETGIGTEQSFEIKIGTLEDEIKAAIAAGESREVTLVLTEEEVSIMLVKMMQEAMNESKDEISEEMVVGTTVNLDGDGIRAIVDIEMYGVVVSAGARLQALVDEDGISLLLEELEVGQLPFVGFIEDKIKDRFNESHTNMSLDDLHIDLEKGLPVELKGLIIRDQEMIITGVVI